MTQKRSLLQIAGKLLFEIVAVVIGISIAFFVDNWKDKRNEEESQIALLRAIQSDIASETEVLQKNIDILTVFINSYANILHNGFTKDSAIFEIDRLITYNPYRPIDLTYKSMKQSGSSSLIKNKNLQYQIINLHERFLTIIDESIAMDRQFVLERMIPFLEKNASYPYDQQLTPALATNREFKNLLRTNILYKSIDKSSLSLYQQYAKTVENNIAEEIKTLD